jgi:hypothetical protein
VAAGPTGSRVAADAELIAINAKLQAIAEPRGAIGVYWDQSRNGFGVLIPASRSTSTPSTA